MEEDEILKWLAGVPDSTPDAYSPPTVEDDTQETDAGPRPVTKSEKRDFETMIM